MKKIKTYGQGFFPADQLLYAFTGREGGYSKAPYASLNLALHVGDAPEDVERNRALLAKELSFDGRKLSWANQVHGDKIFLLKKPNQAGFVGDYDALITNLPGIPLMTMFADCIPILLYDPKERVIASVHAGWKGTFLEIADKAVRKMSSEFSSRPENIEALIGPGICSDHYGVDQQLIGVFHEKFPNLVKKEDSSLNLRGINKEILKKLGLRAINDLDLCPACMKEEFFSYRQEEGRTGRFAAIIMLK